MKETCRKMNCFYMPYDYKAYQGFLNIMAAQGWQLLGPVATYFYLYTSLSGLLIAQEERTRLEITTYGSLGSQLYSDALNYLEEAECHA